MTLADSDPELAALDANALLDLFKTLESPPLAEMHGEYDGRLLRQPHWPATLFWNAMLKNPVWPGLWRGKAFRPVSDTAGRGYNLFRLWGRLVLRYPMATLIAPSRYDGRPAFQLVYRAYHSSCGAVHMVDEVRRLRPGAYLLIGTMGFTDKQRMVPVPVLLEGPVAEYRRDIGWARKRFDPADEVPGLKVGR
jgi:hypothetical protein